MLAIQSYPETYSTISCHWIFYPKRKLSAGRKQLIQTNRRLLDELQAQSQFEPLVHSHTCAVEAENFRSVLDKHPHWERLMELYNLGGTERTYGSFTF